VNASAADFAALEAPVVVACSGGADSLALLVLAAAAGVRPIAVHVDHGLRAEGAFEAGVVAAAASRLGAPFRAVRAVIGAGPNLEARARDARYAALERVRRQEGASTVLTGHTADDQAETVLLNLLRGAGGPGLAGIRPRAGRVRRPLLTIRRADTRALCARQGLAPVEDPMNADVAFRRVLVRREVLPTLARAARRDVVPVLARQAAVLRAESDLLDELASQALDAARGPGEDLRASDLAAQPVALARRAVRSWLGAPPPSFDEVERVLAVARGEARAAELAGGVRVERRDGQLRAVTATLAQRHTRVDLPGGANAAGWRVETWVEREVPRRWPDGRWTGVLDAELAGREARLVTGGARPAVLLRPDGSVLWRLGYGVGAAARIGPGTRRFLWVTAESTEHATGAGTGAAV
jgi:tRNA(Ile)-lysidine synthase